MELWNSQNQIKILFLCCFDACDFYKLFFILKITFTYNSVTPESALSFMQNVYNLRSSIFKIV